MKGADPLKEYYKITNKQTGHMSYYKSLTWLEYYLQSCFGGLRDMEIVESEWRLIDGEEIEIIKLAHAHCGFYGQNTYRIELVKG